jgi:pteridine reductase
VGLSELQHRRRLTLSKLALPRDGMKKVALVTGGAVRLGRGISLMLARLGCQVVVHFHGSADSAHQLVDEIGSSGGEAIAIQADLAQVDAISKLFESIDARLGGVDFLVNNAAIFERVPFEQISHVGFERMWSLNAAAPFWCAQQAVRRMRQRGGGSIVNITDIAAERPFPGHAHYCMSKAALLSLTRSLAVELAPQIRVNAVAPGAILFPESYEESRREAVLKRVPMGRTGSVAELAEAVRFLLLGPEFVTGQVIAVDGGRSARL